jgi:hypothetical protein
MAYVCADAEVPVMGSNGSSVHVQEMIRSLQHHGARVELYAARVGGEPPPDLASTPLHQLPGLGGGEQAEREAAAMAANQAVRTLLDNSGLFDLVYERHSLFSYAAMEHAQACDSASVLEVNAPLIDEQQRYRTLVHHDAATRAATRAFAAAGTIVAVSSEVAACVRALGADPAKVHVLGNGVNLDLPPRPPLRCRHLREH